MNYFEIEAVKSKIALQRVQRTLQALEAVKSQVKSDPDKALTDLQALINWIEDGEPLEAYPEGAGSIPDESLGIACMEDGVPIEGADTWFDLILQCDDLVDDLESLHGNGELVRSILKDGKEIAGRRKE